MRGGGVQKFYIQDSRHLLSAIVGDDDDDDVMVVWLVLVDGVTATETHGLLKRGGASRHPWQ